VAHLGRRFTWLGRWSTLITSSCRHWKMLAGAARHCDACLATSISKLSRCPSRWPWGPLEGPREPITNERARMDVSGGACSLSLRPRAHCFDLLVRSYFPVRRSRSPAIGHPNLVGRALGKLSRSYCRFAPQSGWTSAGGSYRPSLGSHGLVSGAESYPMHERSRNKVEPPLLPIALQHLRSRSGVPF
jgi:hypothetical protein